MFLKNQCWISNSHPFWFYNLKRGILKSLLFCYTTARSACPQIFYQLFLEFELLWKCCINSIPGQVTFRSFEGTSSLNWRQINMRFHKRVAVNLKTKANLQYQLTETVGRLYPFCFWLHKTCTLHSLPSEAEFLLKIGVFSSKLLKRLASFINSSSRKHQAA